MRDEGRRKKKLSVFSTSELTEATSSLIHFIASLSPNVEYRIELKKISRSTKHNQHSQFKSVVPARGLGFTVDLQV